MIDPNCKYGTVYFGINLDVPPFDKLEARQDLAAITDRENKETYLQDMFGSKEGLTNFLIPPIFLEEYAYKFKDITYQFNRDITSLINASGQLSLAYCEDCEGNKDMAEGFASLWEEELGFKVNLVPISHDEYQMPITDGSLPLYFKYFTATSWLDFTKDAVDEGYFMIPEEKYDGYMQLVKEAELEEDKEKQAQKIMKIDRLLVEECAVAIPVWGDINCE